MCLAEQSSPAFRYYYGPTLSSILHMFGFIDDCLLWTIWGFDGYYLQFRPTDKVSIIGNVNYPYEAEWRSDIIISVSAILCVTLNISLPAQFHIYAALLSNGSSRTVYKVDSSELEPSSAQDLLVTFEVPLTSVVASELTPVQLVVYVSRGTVIRNAVVVNSMCPVISMWLLTYTRR